MFSVLAVLWFGGVVQPFPDCRFCILENRIYTKSRYKSIGHSFPNIFLFSSTQSKVSSSFGTMCVNMGPQGHIAELFAVLTRWQGS